MAEQAIRFCDISKHFGEVKASNHVSFSLKKGEILALLGENGSGKTTLMNMLSGIYFPDSGHIEVNGAAVSIRSPKDAFQLGIGMIHQHFKLIPVFTAAEKRQRAVRQARRLQVPRLLLRQARLRLRPRPRRHRRTMRT